MVRRPSQIFRLPGLLVVLAFACSLGTQAQSAKSEESVERAYRAYVLAWKTKDLTALNKVISPDYMAVNFEGKLSSKENELATAKHDNDWAVMTVDEIHTRVCKHGSVASRFISAQQKTQDGRPINARVRFLAMLVKRDGRLQ